MNLEKFRPEAIWDFYFYRGENLKLEKDMECDLYFFFMQKVSSSQKLNDIIFQTEINHSRLKEIEVKLQIF